MNTFIALVLLTVASFGVSGKVFALTTPTEPVINFTVNGSAGIVTANAGDPLTIDWSATNVAYCRRWGNWGAGSLLTGFSGTETLTALFPTVVTGYLYEIDCYDEANVHVGQAGVQVNVTPVLTTPTPTPTPTPTATVQKVKGEGLIAQSGDGFVIVNNLKVVYTLETRVKTATGSIEIGMKAKWEGTVTNGSTTVNATRLEVQ